jgi:hypothetical protein
MKTPTLVCLITMGLVAASAASSVYIQNFNGYSTSPSDDVNGQDGWTINNTADQYSFVYPTLANQGNGINLGDASVVDVLPPVSPVTLSHAYTGQMGGLTLAFDFAIIDSYAAGFYHRDNFGISLTNGSTNLLSIIFTPQIPTPSDPTVSDTNGAWDVDYSSAYGSGTLNMTFFETNQYQFLLECVANGANTDFTLSLTGGNTRSDTKTLSLDPSALADQFNINWAKVGSNAYGSNYIALDNLAIVPEPSSALLLCLAGLGFVARRKRA